jgi:pilus assembly protein Flp/PilA
MHRIRTFLKSEDGIAVTEYALLVALVAMLLVAVVTVFGTKISSWFEKKTNSITTV